MQLFTGRIGKGHVKGFDDAVIFRSSFDNVVLPEMEQLQAYLEDNTVSIKSGILLMQGRLCAIKGTYNAEAKQWEGSEEISIDTEEDGLHRIDYIIVEYSINGEIESTTLKVLKGTPSAEDPQLPKVITGNMMKNELSQAVLWEVHVFGDTVIPHLIDHRNIVNYDDEKFNKYLMNYDISLDALKSYLLDKSYIVFEAKSAELENVAEYSKFPLREYFQVLHSEDIFSNSVLTFSNIRDKFNNSYSYNRNDSISLFLMD